MKFRKTISMGNVRKSQQDAMTAIEISDNCAMFAVCDGMGGMDGGAEASALVCREIDEYVNSKIALSKKLNKPITMLNIDNTIVGADMKIVREIGSGSGTTVAAVFIHDDIARISHAGDSRVYAIKDGELKFVTKDQNMEASLLASGATREVATIYQNVLENYVGSRKTTVEKIKVKAFDYILLCTDGLNKHVEDSEIVAHINMHGLDAADTLLRLTNSRGGSDNTAIIICKRHDLTAY